MEHIGSGKSWDLSRKNGGLVILPPYGREMSTVYNSRFEAISNSAYYLREAEEDYVVISAFTIFQTVKKKMKESAKLTIIDLSLNKQTLNLLHKAPKGTRALLVNIYYRNCMEVITKIYNLGYKHF